jgi:transcriptional regulator GlxA family with amidase domain
MDTRVVRVIARMEDCLEQPLSVGDLAAAVNLSTSRLSHLFRQQTGVPPARYLHDLRLARARVLLERTFLSVKQVMTCVGLHDPSHFTRDFRRTHGVAPSQLRQRSWAADFSTPPRGARPVPPGNGQER